MDKNPFNSSDDFDKNIERDERLIQTFIIVLGVLVSFNGNLAVQKQLIFLYIIFIFVAIIYYVALPVSMNKYANIVNSVLKDINASDSVFKELANSAQSLSKIADEIDCLSKKDPAYRSLDDHTRVGITKLCLIPDKIQSRCFDLIKKCKIALNTARFYLFVLGAFTASIFSFFLYSCLIGISDGYLHSFSSNEFIGYLALTVIVSIGLYV